ncbi:MAG: hypothetical protein WAO55_15950 [Candidatus Manganitrophaceae bacterium]
MKKTAFFTAVIGLALVFGTAAKSNAGCFIGCGGDDESYESVGGDKVGGDQNQFTKLAETITDSVVTQGVDVKAADSHVHVDGDAIGSQISANSNALIQGVDKSHNNFNDSDTTFNVTK